jgi:hypothetical protein
MERNAERENDCVNIALQSCVMRTGAIKKQKQNSEASTLKGRTGHNYKPLSSSGSLRRALAPRTTNLQPKPARQSQTW